MTRLLIVSVVFWFGLGGCGWIGLDFLSKSNVDDDASAGCEGGDCRDACVGAACSACVGLSCECTDGGPPTGAGVCGCGSDGHTDSDADGTLDCVDFCPDQADRLVDGSCGCSAAAGDEDGDGVPNCQDYCPLDDAKVEPGMCGCGLSELDSDSDGTSDCMDECPDAPGKIRPGMCGCDRSDADTDLDGTPDCMDSCSGAADSIYATETSCGVGYCRDTSVPSTCIAGVETPCKPGAPLGPSDATCDGVDDDCDGTADENFTGQATSCGKGPCANTGMTACTAGSVSDSCTPHPMPSADDTTCDGVDDDCDGTNDDDVAPVPVSCGSGICGTNGVIACVDGMLVNSCIPTGMSSPDVDCDNIDDDCDGAADEEFVPTSSSCGLGVCARSGTITCVSGSLVDSCVPGTAGSDTSCNAQDDDCDGRVDEHYMPMPTSCGTGACARTGTRSCSGGTTSDSCVPGSPAASDDAFAPGNGVDDDCDGRVDEDVPACNTTARTFEAGAYMNIAVPGNCHNLTVRLWGGGGAGGSKDALAHAAGGRGGPGGYAQATVLVTTPIHLYVGGGAANNCNAGGTNAGSSSYNGGTGGPTEGGNGADGVVAGGGNGGDSSSGYDGGRGYFGGGGGGEGNTSSPTSGNGAGGGAASVLIVNGVRAAVAGGGGGGGGGSGLVGTGGIGGSGCGAAGQASTADGGGGGGGGMCQGGTTQTGSGANPAFSGDIPSGRARGGSSSCGAGGAGYAILTFSP